MMKAAVVQSFDQPPKYAEFQSPSPAAGEVLVTIRTAALSQLVRSQASGTHYSSKQPPLVPGVDGVGTLADGRRVYFALPRFPFGAMAEQTVVPLAYTVPLPDGLDDVTAAAAGNPGMSSWAALVERAKFVRGETVLIIGATGTAGRLAIQIAKHLGASRVVATGRTSKSEAELKSLGADAFIATEQPAEALTAAFASEINGPGVNVVLDYLFGPVASAFFAAAGSHGDGGASPRIRYVNIGSLAGGTITLPAQSLRSSGLELLGSGLGSVSHAALIRSIAGVMNAFVPAGFKIAADAVPLSQVETSWMAKSGDRIVFTV